MNDDINQMEYAEEIAVKQKKEMSRRQFLCYTLGGAGGFMAAGVLAPMLRFAVDPILQKKGASDWVKVVEASKVTDVPVLYSFTKHQVDGWYESDPEFGAFIMKDASGSIYALSNVCTHLGCTVDWASDKSKPDEFNCPCHGSHFDVRGKNLMVAPRPLDQFDVKVENDFVYLGALRANTEVNKEA